MEERSPYKAEAAGSKPAPPTTPTLLVVPFIVFFVGCATGTAFQHEARVRDAVQCELEAESYLGAVQNRNELRYLMLESCMAMRGHTSR